MTNLWLLRVVEGIRTLNCAWRNFFKPSGIDLPGFSIMLSR